MPTIDLSFYRNNFVNLRKTKLKTMKRAFKILCGVLVAIIALMLIVPALLSGKIGDIVKKEANEMVDATVDFAKLDISLFRHFPKASETMESMMEVRMLWR